MPDKANPYKVSEFNMSFQFILVSKYLNAFHEKSSEWRKGDRVRKNNERQINIL